MAYVTGNINHIGLEPIPQGRRLVLEFVASNAAVGNQTMLAEKWPVSVEPAPDGSFGVTLAATDNLHPIDTYYRIQAMWWHDTIDGEGWWERDEFLPFRLCVPINGGEIGDLLRADHDDGRVWTGDRPIAPVVGMRWVDESGRLWEYDGREWHVTTQLTVMSSKGVPKEQYVGTNVSAERIPWEGIVYWLVTEGAGFPIHAQQGDKIIDVAPVASEIVIADTFDRADGPAGSTPTGGVPWTIEQGGGATGATAQIVSGMLRVAGHNTGYAQAMANTGQVNGYTRFRVGAIGPDRLGSLIIRGTDINNCVQIGFRTSATDSTARVVTTVAGTTTHVASLSVTLQPNDVVGVRYRGAQVEVLVNASTVWTGSIESNRGGTKVGLRVYGTPAAEKNLACDSFDFAVEA